MWVTLLDNSGNDGVDESAVAGAEQHPVDFDIGSMSGLRKNQARNVHCRFTAIIQE